MSTMNSSTESLDEETKKLYADASADAAFVNDEVSLDSSAASATLNSQNSTCSSFTSFGRTRGYRIEFPNEGPNAIPKFVLETLNAELDSVNDNDLFIKKLQESNNEIAREISDLQDDDSADSPKPGKGSRLKTKLRWLFGGQGSKEAADESSKVAEAAK